MNLVYFFCCTFLYGGCITFYLRSDLRFCGSLKIERLNCVLTSLRWLDLVVLINWRMIGEFGYLIVDKTFCKFSVIALIFLWLHLLSTLNWYRMPKDLEKWWCLQGNSIQMIWFKKGDQICPYLLPGIVCAKEKRKKEKENKLTINSCTVILLAFLV